MQRIFVTMWPNKARGFTLIELLVSISILTVMILASIPLLSSDKERSFKDNVQKVATFIEKAKSFSLNPNTDNQNDTFYRINRTGGNFMMVGVRINDGSEIETPVGDQVLDINGLGYEFCSVGANIVEFNVGNGSATAASQIGIKKDSYSSGIEITKDGQIKILQSSPC